MSPECCRIVTHEQVMFFDTDCGGVVHNLAYLRMVEAARTRLATKMGLDLRKMGETGVFTVVVRHEIDYIRPGHIGDELRIEGWLDSVEKASLWFRFELYRESDNLLLLKAHQRIALVKMPSGKPMRVPPEWQAMLHAPQ